MEDVLLNRPFIVVLALNELLKSSLPPKRLNHKVYQQVCHHIESGKDRGTLVLTGGEPFLDSRLGEILSLALNKGWFTSVDTLCMFQENPLLDKVQQIRLRLFSLHSKLHNRLAGDDQSFEKTMAFAKGLAQNFAGEKILIIPLCRENFKEIGALLQWCRRFNFIPNIFVVPRQHDYAFDGEDYPAVLEELRSFSLENVILDVPLLGLSGWPNLCPGGRLAIFVGVEGEIKPCPYFPYPLDILEDNLNQAWKRMQKKIKEMNEGCRYCEHFLKCGGGCLCNKLEKGTDCYCPSLYASCGR